jgi:ribose transport system substrate-binding protein
MVDSRKTMSVAVLAGSLFLSLPVLAEDFHGFDPANVGPETPTAADLQAMVADAMTTTPPRNGDRYVIGYTMWGGNSPFSLYNKQGLEDLAEMAGVDIVTADNEWDPNKNVANVQTFATRNVDYVINSLLDVQFAPAVKAPLDAEGIPLVALDIPVPGAQWMGVDNARAGFRAGTYIAQSAVSRWGDAANEATLVVVSFPLVGPNGRLRNESQVAGVQSVLDLPEDRIIWLETDATQEGGYAQMNNILTRLDPDAPLLITSFSDEVLSGVVRAATVGGLAEQTIAVGMGGEMLELVASDPIFIASMSFFPERYANAALPMALATLAGREIPSSVFAYTDLVTPANVCEVDPDIACQPVPDWMAEDAEIDEAAYTDFVRSLHDNPYYDGFEMLLPPA